MPSPNSLLAVLPENWQIAGFGLYIHWPFCAAKCPYCDFNSHVTGSIDQARWKRAYVAEIKRLGEETKGRILTSVFFGGGTPSLMDPDVVAEILDTVKEAWTTANDLEITLEANPTSVEAGRFRGYHAAGVNRVSLGVQALNDADLKALGRLHTAAEALAAVEMAQSAFDRVSFDLIYARQHQGLAEWDQELRLALALNPSHLSLYQLTIEQGTAFGDRFNRGKLPGLPDEDLGADLYLRTQEICGTAGLPAYEVSNHAQPGQESRHNLLYWRSGDWGGIGPGAHGRLSFGGRRWAIETPVAPGDWLQRVERDGLGELDRMSLLAADRDAELLMMGLRTNEGVLLNRLVDTNGFTHNINELCKSGFLTTSSDMITPTAEARPVLNAVIRQLLSEVDDH